ncbi:hypothetical protein BHE90_014338 [Fusarium euwallaceae]|uniref:Uncharacterized protein n=2 Tax=Fusarium solani species complex TaxID=232080 RepID=A0A3M2SNF3_9HYPO|nr:hypothetical protein CDV36_001269 [Fusarium kuroshium]RTE71263.1 hypothetical protein BHE90_014338 [Fusarium euwallaceae]
MDDRVERQINKSPLGLCLTEHCLSLISLSAARQQTTFDSTSNSSANSHVSATQPSGPLGENWGKLQRHLLRRHI